MSSLHFSLQVLSTFSILLPIAASLWVFKRAGLKIRLFTIFLIAGFITDLLGWYFYLTRNSEANTIARYIYSLIESLFLFWFISQSGGNKTIRAISSKAWLVIIVTWPFCWIFAAISPFETLYQVALAFFSGFSILGLAEKEENVITLPEFWLLLGIFFYCFCTFFFMSLMATQLGLDLWFLHNIINILTNFMFFIGLLKLTWRRDSPTNPS